MPVFEHQVNAGFMQVVSSREINLRVYERGAGETLACGSGACDAVTSGIRRGFLGNDVLVHMRGGDIRVRWSGESEACVYLSGPAVTGFTGEIDLDRIVLPTANF